MPFQLSPGVSVVEKDFSSIVPAVSTSAGAFAGSFRWGPVMDPVQLSSENLLVERFGAPNDANFMSFFTAANFLSYTNNLLVVRADADGLKNAVTTPSGSVSGITLTDGGSGYASAPAINIGASDNGGTDATATAVLATTGGEVVSIAVGAGGDGYTVAPTITISAPAAGGSTATAVASVVDGAVDGITVTDGGSGYASGETVTITITEDAGDTITTAATATATLGFAIASITLDEAGTGYDSSPDVTISGNATATAGSITLAGVKIKNTDEYLDAYSGGQGLTGEFAAKYPGTLGNSISVHMADSSTWTNWASQYKAEFDGAPGTSSAAVGANKSSADDQIHILVLDTNGAWTGTAGAVIEKFSYLSKAGDAKRSDGSAAYYKDVINSQSKYVWWTDHPTDVGAGTAWGSALQTMTGESFAALTAPVAAVLTGGEDDFNLTDAAHQNALAIFANDELYDIALVAMGAASATTATYAINNIAEARKDCMVFVSPQDSEGNVITNSTLGYIEKLITYRDALPSTSYGVMDSGFKYQYDRYNDKYRYVPLNGDTAGISARTDFEADPWFSPGGFARGQVKNVVKLAVTPSKLERDELYKVGINPVVTFPGQGTVLFGDKTLLAQPSAFDRINVRRLFITVQKAIATAAKFQLFEFNDAFTRAQFRNLVEPFLRDVQGRRGIVDFRVKCDDSNNTGEVVDRNEFVADIFIKPNRSINFITLTFVAARSAVNFDEIGA